MYSSRKTIFCKKKLMIGKTKWLRSNEPKLFSKSTEYNPNPNTNKGSANNSGAGVARNNVHHVCMKLVNFSF